MVKLLTFALLFVALLFSVSYAQGYGKSVILVNITSISAQPGATVLVGYTVKLYSGYTWGTSIQYSNAAALANEGINAHFSTSNGDPTFSGTLYIQISNNTNPGTYTISLYATGDDPSVNQTNITLTVFKPQTQPTTSINQTAPVTQAVPQFILKAISTVHVNASNGANLSILNGSIRVVVRPGTYIKSGSNIYSSYNFSLAFFNVQNVTSPPNYTDYKPSGAFAFEVNKQITPTIEFVNSSGAPYPIITFVAAGYNTTSWTFLGGTLAQNGSAYIGGKYAFADSWSHPNSTTMVNNAFVKPVMWVFETKVPTSISNSTTVTTAPTSTTPPPVSTSSPAYSNSGNPVTYIAVIIIVIIILVAYFALRNKKKQ